MPRVLYTQPSPELQPGNQILLLKDGELPLVETLRPGAFVMGEQGKNILHVRTLKKVLVPLAEYAVQADPEDFLKHLEETILDGLKDRLQALRTTAAQETGRFPKEILIFVRVPPTCLPDEGSHDAPPSLIAFTNIGMAALPGDEEGDPDFRFGFEDATLEHPEGKPQPEDLMEAARWVGQVLRHSLPELFKGSDNT